MLRMVEGPDLNKICVPVDANYRKVLQVLQSDESRLCVVTGEGQEILGTITDGDCRRAFLQRSPQEISAAEIMNTRILVVNENFTQSQIEALMTVNGIAQIPMVDNYNRLICLFHAHGLGSAAEKLSSPVVILAGGLGTRLRPLTETTPKPMLQVHGRPILERIIGQLVSAGFINIFISVNYLASQIIDYFGDGSKWGCSIKYLKEEIPLGTAGPLTLLPQEAVLHATSPVLVINGDILSNVNYRQFFYEHAKSGNSATVGFFAHGIDVPYGVLTIDEKGNITDIREKPTIQMPVSAGIYILNQELIAEIPPKRQSDMPQIIEKLVRANIKVGSFNIIETWIDIGTPPQLRAARDLPAADT